MRTFLKAKWENLIMVNYSIDPKILLPYLPPKVELDCYQDQTFISLVGFLFKDSKIFNVPIPILGTFEEVNLRFYVVRKINHETRRGVVFINETVPNKIVSYLANKLYKEHYSSIPTQHNWSISARQKNIEYHWKVNTEWNSIKVIASNDEKTIEMESMEEFIFEHYYGYTHAGKNNSLEYKVNHPRWTIHDVHDYEVRCDFEKFYGKDFSILNHTKPHSVMLAKGSDIGIDWKRVNF